MASTIEARRRSAWEIVVIGGLFAAAAGPLLVMVLDQRLALIGLVFAAIPLAMAGLVLTRNRWLIAVVVLVSAVFLVSGLRAPIVQARLANPAAIGYFLVAFLEMAGSAVATVASLILLGRSVPARAAG